MRDLSELAHGVEQDPSGIWRTRIERAHRLSFPEHGHDACFRIEDDSFWFTHRNACIAAVLMQEHVAGPLLDLGGGNGVVSAALERAGIETILLEPSLEGAHHARARGLRNVVCATVEDAAFEPGVLDAVGTFDVAEHVADDTALFREVHRILRPGGVLCVTVPAYSWLWSAEDDLAGHHRRYTLRAARAVLEGCGFEIRYATYLFAALMVPMFVLRTLPHRMRRGAADVEQHAARQHVPSPSARRLVEMLLAPELRLVEQRRRIPLGTSCLVLAAKP